MKRWIKDWDELCAYERVFRVLTFAFSAVTIILAVLALLRVVHPGLTLFGLACIQFCQAIYSWKKQREIGVFSLLAGTVVLAVMVSFLFM